MKRFLLCVLSIFIVAMSFIGAVLPATAAIDMTMHTQVANIYSGAQASFGRSFNGYCGACVGWQLYHMGINTTAICPNGKDTFDYYKNLSVTTGGYNVTAYSASQYSLKSALNAITANGTKNAYNIVIGLEKGNTASSQTYGHAVVIHAIIDGFCYFAESSNLTVMSQYHAAGTPIVVDINYFCDYIYMWAGSGYTPQFEGVIYFGQKMAAPALTATKTESCKWYVTIPAGYRLDLYYNKTDAAPTSERWINPKDSAYRLSCDEKVSLSDGSVRYHFVSGDGYSVYFKYNSSVMSSEPKHTYYTISSVTPSCTANGKNVYRCINCGYSYTETVVGTGHRYATTYTVDKKPTCTEAGSKSYHCKNCTDKRGVTSIAATGHSWGEWKTVKEATTSATGLSQRKCGSCSATESVTLPKLPEPEHLHNYGSWETVKSPTCKDAGSDARVCRSCGARETRTLSATGKHSLEQKEKQPTCVKKGELKITCKTCDYLEVHETAARGHNFGDYKAVKNPTETEKGLEQASCSGCTEKLSREIPCVTPPSAPGVNTEVEVEIGDEGSVDDPIQGADSNRPETGNSTSNKNETSSVPSVDNSSSDKDADSKSDSDKKDDGIKDFFGNLFNSTKNEDEPAVETDGQENDGKGETEPVSLTWMWYLLIVPVVGVVAVTWIMYFIKKR